MQDLSTLPASDNKAIANQPSMKIGDFFASENHGTVEVIGYHNCNKVEIKFIDTGVTKFKTAANIRNGKVGYAASRDNLSRKATQPKDVPAKDPLPHQEGSPTIDTRHRDLFAGLEMISQFYKQGILDQDTAQKYSASLVP